jgi:hypothetical protein
MFIINEIITGLLKIEFSDAKNEAAFKAIMKEAGAMDSVRYAQAAMSKHSGIRKEIEKISLIVCSDSLYDKDGNAIKEDLSSLREKMI